MNEVDLKRAQSTLAAREREIELLRDRLNKLQEKNSELKS
jgi:hypothetical protein